MLKASPPHDSDHSAGTPTAPLLNNPQEPQDSAAVELGPPPDPGAFARMNTAAMRGAFLIGELFVPEQVRLFYSHIDRAVIGAAVPGGKALLLPSCRELAAEYFTQRRELGLINIGGSGLVRIDRREFHLEKKESLYIGRGHCEISFASDDPENPAQFYFVSYPAHTDYPCAKIDHARTESTELGSTAGSNRRTIHKVIHPAGVASCQLTMGYTELAEGSVWNTMPAHTHLRRSEIYLYFDLPGDGVVVHCLGEPRETRHIVVRDRQAVLSPPWSLHFGVGTTNYSFIWSMGGENQDFADMDMVAMKSLM
jgi:4-deoxy-L-threo-5-hexosulose-uronate ketol-isomerase